MPVDDLELTQRGEGLWTICVPFVALGAQFGRRMVIVSRGGVNALFSPAQNARTIIEDGLGSDFRIDYLIAPTGFHDTYFREVASDFPEATCLVSKALMNKGLRAESLPSSLPTAWADQIVSVELRGMPGVQETVFYDVANEALIVSDMLFHFVGPWGTWSKQFFRLAGMYGGAKVSRLFRFLIKDKLAFRESLKTLMEFPVRQIIPGHGEVISRGGLEALKSIDATFG